MDISIKYASQPEEMDLAFRIRHDVFVTESGYMAPHSDARIYDRFDAFCTSHHIIITLGNSIIGGTRLTENSSAGTSSDEFFNFTSHLPTDPKMAGASSMSCVRRDYQRTRVGFYLFCFAWQTARKANWTHVYGVVNPDVKGMMLKMGAKQIGEESFDGDKGVRFVPMILELQSLSQDYLRVMDTIPGGEWSIQLP